MLLRSASSPRHAVGERQLVVVFGGFASPGPTRPITPAPRPRLKSGQDACGSSGVPVGTVKDVKLLPGQQLSTSRRASTAVTSSTRHADVVRYCQNLVGALSVTSGPGELRKLRPAAPSWANTQPARLNALLGGLHLMLKGPGPCRVRQKRLGRPNCTADRRGDVRSCCAFSSFTE